MGGNTESCTYHHDLMEKFGAQVYENKIQSERLTILTSNLEEMKEKIIVQSLESKVNTEKITEIKEIIQTMNETLMKLDSRSNARDLNVKALSTKLDTVNAKIDNGLTTKVQNLSVKMDQLTKCIDRRVGERDKTYESHFKRGWERFKGNFVYLSFIGGSIWILWVFSRTLGFGDHPEGFLKFFQSIFLSLFRS